MMRLLPAFLLAVATLPAAAQPSRVFVDGRFDDWQGIPPAYTDDSGDAPAGQVDLGRFWVTHDEHSLLLRFELGMELLIQDGNELLLYLDTDDDPATGEQVLGLGAELVWRFGGRTGTYTLYGQTGEIGHFPIGIVTGPTTSSTEFEVAIRRDARPDGSNLLFQGSTVRLALADLGGFDFLPGTGEAIRHTFDQGPLAPLEPIALARDQVDDVRIVSWNVLNSGLFDSGRSDRFRRILQFLDPDIIGFQEVRSESAEAVRAFVAAALPGRPWYASRIEPDIVTVSGYPITGSYRIAGGASGDANGAFAIDMSSVWGEEMLLLNAHPPCCRNDTNRQLDFDAMMAFIRDARAGGTPPIQPETPLVVLGDMNMVGFRRQLRTLLEGAIVNTAFHGAPAAPDGDGSALADLFPRVTHLPMHYTWYSPNSSFHPGRLDFIVFGDAVLRAQNRFVFFTPAMPAEALSALGLESEDTTLASDHLPVVGDFRYAGLGETSAEPEVSPGGFRILGLFPNPASDRARLRLEMDQAREIEVTVVDLLGRTSVVARPGLLAAGAHELALTLTPLPSGIYFLRVGTEPIARLVIAR
ncbi:MAG: endonuclease/exonuclease/phosphatase family protein [Rhodothermales bacterium]|nr:endonuclease/exonuclease/phosphatase family protein [Rhodothermales bacterium]